MQGNVTVKPSQILGHFSDKDIPPMCWSPPQEEHQAYPSEDSEPIDAMDCSYDTPALPSAYDASESFKESEYSNVAKWNRGTNKAFTGNYTEPLITPRDSMLYLRTSAAAQVNSSAGSAHIQRRSCPTRRASGVRTEAGLMAYVRLASLRRPMKILSRDYKTRLSVGAGTLQVLQARILKCLMILGVCLTDGGVCTCFEAVSLNGGRLTLEAMSIESICTPKAMFQECLRCQWERQVRWRAARVVLHK